jgi:hypothetical protein
MKALFTLVLLSFASAAQAQVTSTGEAPVAQTPASATASRLWIVAGPSFSTISTADSSSDVNTRTTFNGGLEAEFALSSTLSFRTGLDYMQKGVSESDGTINLNYLEVPLLAKMNFLLGDDRLALSAGGYAALAISRSASSDDSSDNQDVSDLVNSADFGARFGVAFEIPVQANMSLSIGANYDLGLTNVVKGATGDDKADNRTLSAMIGLGVAI